MSAISAKAPKIKQETHKIMDIHEPDTEAFWIQFLVGRTYLECILRKLAGVII